MRKFYFNKEDSADITPRTLRQERRHSVSAKIDKIEGEKTPDSSRVPNVSSVDRFKNEPVIPRAKTRAVTKSLSEDVLHEDPPSNSAMVIKEDELTSSRLYKILKDSTNHNDSPKQRSEKTGFSPVELKDPKLKPIPVKRRSSSCLCYFIIMMAICICTVGLLTTITGLLYKEIFYGKNFTLHHESDTLVDVSNFASELRQDDSSKSRAFQGTNNELVQKSSDNVDILSENSSYEDLSEENQQGDFRKLNVSNLSQYLDRRKAEIKFQDGDTIIYEMNSSSSLEYEKNTDVRKDMDMEGLGNSGNKLKNSSKNNGRWPDKRIEEKIEELENFDTFVKSHSGRPKDMLVGGSKEDLHTSGSTFNNEMIDSVNYRSVIGKKSEDLNPASTKQEFETLRFQSSVPNSEIKSALLVEEQALSVFPEHKNGNEEKFKSKDLNLSINEEFLKEPKEFEFNGEPTLMKTDEPTAELNVISNQTVDINSKSNAAKPNSRSRSSSVIRNVVKDSASNVTSKPQLMPFDNSEEKNSSLMEPKEISSVSEKESQKNQQNRNDYYVESMLEVINESEDLKDTISERDGDIISFTEFSSTTLQPIQSSIILKNPVAQVTTELKSFKDQRASSPKEQAIRIKPLDLRVSLAEAMKHLQVLDVNNKILTSRAKPNGRKPQNTKQAINQRKYQNTKQSSKEDISQEKMQYLQNLRLMLQENMQRA